jgi:N-acetylglutamate synthase-like GNAT family acetyltransferase
MTQIDVLHWQDVPRRAQRAAWVAVEDGEIAGWGDAQARWEVSEQGVCELWAAVTPKRRGRRVGSQLFELAWTHLVGIGARVVESWAEEEEGKRFLRNRGFDEVRQERISAVDPREVDLSRFAELEAAKRAENFRVVPLAETLDRARELFAVYMAGKRTCPARSRRTTSPSRNGSGRPFGCRASILMEAPSSCTATVRWRSPGSRSTERESAPTTR